MADKMLKVIVVTENIKYIRVLNVVLVYLCSNIEHNIKE